MITLTELDKKIAVLETKVEDHIKHSSIAVDKAENAVNERLAKMNEFRDQLKDQAKTFVTYDVYSAMIKAVDEKLNYVTKMVYIGIGIFIVVQIVIQKFL
jgi:hypothetical protein